LAELISECDRRDSAHLRHFVGLWSFFVAPKEDDAAVAPIKELADGESHPDALFVVGIAHAIGRGVEADVGAALVCWRKAAALGHTGAMNAAATLLLQWDVGPEGPAESVDLLRKAAKLGNPLAIANLAGCYLGGLGVPTCPAVATDLIRAAADAGETRAMVHYAGMLRSDVGRTGAVDWDRICRLCHAAADDGQPDAFVALALMHVRGSGVARDSRHAFALLQRARHAGHPSVDRWLAPFADAAPPDRDL
jgi:uncharacterized protein